jgi:hypothetical protein
MLVFSTTRQIHDEIDYISTPRFGGFRPYPRPE